MSTGFFKAILILPGTALIYVPALILWLTNGTSAAARLSPPVTLALIAGLGCAGMGLWLMGWTMRLYLTKGGGGTPAPWEPIRNFIVLGPYRYMRNPMLSGVILFQIAEALLLGSWPLAVWAGVFFGLNTVYFIYREEPELRQRFGGDYERYLSEVPRWVPRRTPYSG